MNFAILTCNIHYLLPPSINTIFTRINILKFSFFPYTISKWNKLDLCL